VVFLIELPQGFERTIMPRVPYGLLLLALLLTSVVPISSDAFWWDLARGRAVVEGWTPPLRTLLAAETSFEADWLGGLPAYLVHSWFGASGIMLAGLILAAWTGRLLWKRLAAEHSPWGGWSLLVCMLLATRGAWGLSSETFDLLGLLAWGLLWERFGLPGDASSGDAVSSSKRSRTPEETRPGRAVLSLVSFPWLTGFAFLLWANFGPRVVLGLTLLAVAAALGGHRVSAGQNHALNAGWVDRCRSMLSAFCRSPMLVALGVAVLAASLTPRGLWGLADSWRLTWPDLAAPTAVLRAAGWRSSAESFDDPAVVAFLVLSLWSVWQLLAARASVAESVCFLVVQGTAWLDRAALPMAAIWSALLITRHGRQPASLPTFFEKLKRPAGIAGSVGCFVLGITAAAGWWPGSPQRMGWGIHPRLEPRLCEMAWTGMDLTGTAFCPDVRSAGLVAWLRPTGLQPDDVPHRALLRGQLEEHVLLWRDLAANRRGRYRREDPPRESTWFSRTGAINREGGWWIPLQERETRILMVPAEETVVIRAMEPETWKPLALDSPVIPFAQASDPVATARIVEVLGQRELVNFGPWSYQPPDPSGNDLYLDLWGWITRQPDPSPGIQQARVFRAMNLHYAALRVLMPWLDAPPHPAAQDEFTRCQIELAHHEWRLMGTPSTFRRRASLLFPRPDDLPLPVWWNEAVASNEDDHFEHALPAYRGGRPGDAASLLTGNAAELLYARGLLLLESGDPAAAEATLRQLLEQHPESRLTIGSQDVLDAFTD
jgi:hypothetical protein